jgi:hypothetical protein
MRIHMRNLRRTIHSLVILVMVSLLSGCFTVRIVRNVENPDRYFDKAYAEIERIHERYPNREGRSRRIHVLIYKEQYRELVKIRAPFWFVNSYLDIGISDTDVETLDLDERYDIDWRDIRDLEKMGPGLLVEIDDEQNKVLIWLD